MAWTTEKAVADGFARGHCRSDTGGSVLLQTLAPAGAIMTEPDQEFGEAEVLVDRRRLGRVEVIARYSHIS